MKKLIAGNWKMNGSWAEAGNLTENILRGIGDEAGLEDKCDFVIFPPYIHLGVVKEMLTEADSPLVYGAQDCALADNGAYTGDISAALLGDFGCAYVILGHSERREYHQESNETVKNKAAMAHSKNIKTIKTIKTIICIGEQGSERDSGQEKEVVERQLLESLPGSANAENTVIAYEPVWAIGTGKTATPDDVRDMHGFIREKLGQRLENAEKIRILYGGSMKPENAKELLATPNVDGGLIGGASLSAESFIAIAKSA